MASTATPIFDDRRSPLFEIFVVVLALAPFFLLAAVYRELPDPVPVHWDLGGRPDRFARSTLVSVFTAPLVGLYLQGLFLMIRDGIARSQPTTPAAFAEPWTRVKAAQIEANVRLLDWVRVAEGALIFAVSGAIGSSAPSLAPYGRVFAGIAFAAGIALAAGGVYWTVRLVSLRREERSLPRSTAPRSPDARAYRLGGTIYYEPADPSLFVEKRWGVGQTINFAHPRAKWLVAYILGLPLMLAVLIASS
jgi:uncharacterized membrane protein